MASPILLISTNRCVTPDPVFPLGLVYLNAALRQAGHATQWLDLQAQGADALDQALSTFKPRFVGISLRNIDDVLIRKRETYFGELLTLCERIRKESQAIIILGGSGFSIFPKELLALSGAEYGICGEGEHSLVRLLEALENRQDPSGVPGLVVRRNGGVTLYPQDPLPVSGHAELADWPESLVRHYLQTSGMLNLQTQRGCAHACSYCTYPVIEGRKHRRREPQAVADEFALLERLGARYVFVVDSIFNSSPAHAAEICEELARRNSKLQWGCFLRPQGLTSELLQLMARAGLAHIEFGTDSFCDDVLAAYGKGFTFADILHSSNLAQQQNLDYCHFLICGGPGETRQTLHAGFNNAQHLRGGVCMAVTGMRIYPGTVLYERAKKEARIDGQTDLLSPVYYLAPGLEPDSIFEELQTYARSSPNWIVGDPSPAYASLVQRLRQRRVVGPLWSYFSMLQRLWPQPAPS